MATPSKTNIKKNIIRLFLVDDHHVFREGIQALFEHNPTIRVVGEAADGSGLIRKLKGIETDILLLDIDMPRVNGVKIIDTVVEEFPLVKVLIFSMHDSAEYIHQMLKKGAKGYLLKSCRKEELFLAIKKVAEGEVYISEENSKKLISYITNLNKHQSKKNQPSLTKREIQVIKLVATGITNHEIGKQLNISHRTVDTHRQNIMEKLNLHNAVALTNYVAKNNL